MISANNSLDNNIYKLEKSLNILLGILIYSSTFYFLSFITADPDLWGHIKFGEDLWRAKTLPAVDIYSYTAYGKEWINHEWVSELLMFFVFNFFGSPGLLIGKLLIGFLIIFLITIISRHRTTNIFAYSFVFIISIFVMSPGFMTRPQILTFLFTSMFLFVFHLFLERRKKALWVLPLIMIVWVNGHGGFLIGLGMFPIVVISEIVSCSLKKKDMKHVKSLIFWLIITEAAVFVNPYGYRLLIFLYESLTVPRNISEWRPVTIFDLSYLRFKLLAVLFFLSLGFKNNIRRHWEIGLITIVLIYAFRHQRHTPLFAIVVAPYLTEMLAIVFKKSNFFKKIKTVPSLLILFIFLCTLIGYQLYFTGSKYIRNRCNIIVDPRKYPVYAIDFLKANRVKGNILLPFEWGEYAIWKLHPDCRVSIDGRFRTVYPQKILDDHFKAINNYQGWMELLNKYLPEIILARRSPNINQLISKKTKWLYIYSDPYSIVFIKDDNSNKDVIEKFKRKDLFYPEKELSLYFP